MIDCAEPFRAENGLAPENLDLSDFGFVELACTLGQGRPANGDSGDRSRGIRLPEDVGRARNDDANGLQVAFRDSRGGSEFRFV